MALVCIEVILGMGWTIVLFSAIIAYLQPRFSQIAKKQAEEELTEKAEPTKSEAE
jgi:hypothetical protein